MSSTRSREDRIEPKIETAVKENLAELHAGYVGAGVIQRMGTGENSGSVDLMLLPKEAAPHRMVLVEAKRANNPEAASKAVGQLLMYYAGALEFGATGIQLINEYANPPAGVLRRELQRVSAQEVCSPAGGRRLAREIAWGKLRDGKKLQPSDIGLFIALNGPPVPSLCLMLDKLHSAHCLEIGVIVTQVVIKPFQIRAVGRPSEPGGLVEFQRSLTA